MVCPKHSGKYKKIQVRGVNSIIEKRLFYCIDASRTLPRISSSFYLMVSLAYLEVKIFLLDVLVGTGGRHLQNILHVKRINLPFNFTSFSYSW